MTNYQCRVKNLELVIIFVPLWHWVQLPTFAPFIRRAQVKVVVRLDLSTHNHLVSTNKVIMCRQYVLHRYCHLCTTLQFIIYIYVHLN
jgi:hypothetical protein